MNDMQTNSQQTEGAVAVRSGDLLCRDRDTLSRWWCEMNVFEWPKDFPMPKPEGWDAMSDMQRREAGKPAWEAISAAIPYPGALEYWSKTFLPRRHNSGHELPRREQS